MTQMYINGKPFISREIVGTTNYNTASCLLVKYTAANGETVIVSEKAR